MNENMIKGFIFDMDGVITSSSDEHFSAWCQLLEDEGYSVDPKVEELTRGVSRMESLEAILVNLGVSEKYTLEQKKDMAARKNKAYVSLIDKFTPANLYPGVLDLLNTLKESGYKIGLGSASKNSLLLTDRLEIAQYFDFVVDVSNGQKSKPAPDIFIAAAKGLGLKNEECLGIEDSIAGVEAIKSANMFAVGIGDSKQLLKADIIYCNIKSFDLNEVLNLANKQ